MNVVLTHLHLDFPGGSETYTHTVAPHDIRAHLDRLLAVYAEAMDVFERRRLSLPAQEVEVARMGFPARLPDPEDPPHVEDG